MARKDPANLPIRKFLGKYANDIFAAEEGRKPKVPPVNCFAFTVNERGDYEAPSRIATTELRDAVERLWPIRLLRAAQAENDVEGYKRVLYVFLVELGVTPPNGVLLPFRWKAGRPQEKEMIYVAWAARGKPPLDWRMLDKLAKIFYRDEFSKALSDGKLRKNLRDRVRDTIRRYEPEDAARKPQRIS